MSDVIDLIGKKFTRLTVEMRAGSNDNGKALWFCLCDCGRGIVTSGVNLRRGLCKSCGCLNKQSKKHGAAHRSAKTPTYNSWLSMRQRCLDPKFTKYARWGGRGIKICDRWMKFENFLADMGERPPGTTLDRRDNDGHYEPGNCRWASPKEQMRHRRAPLEAHEPAQIRWLLTQPGVTGKALAGFFGISSQTVFRIRDGKIFAED